MLDRTRAWINNNSAAATVVVLAVLLSAVASLALRGRAARARPAEVWYYDPTTDKTFTASAAELPPITSPDGHEAVRAYYFSCGPCTREGRFMGYYEKFTPETKKKLEGDREAMMLFPGPIPGRLYSADGKTWHEEGSEAGRRIAEAAYTRCPEALQACLPEDEERP